MISSTCLRRVWLERNRPLPPFGPSSSPHPQSSSVSLVVVLPLSVLFVERRVKPTQACCGCAFVFMDQVSLSHAPGPEACERCKESRVMISHYKDLLFAIV